MLLLLSRRTVHCIYFYDGSVYITEAISGHASLIDFLAPTGHVNAHLVLSVLGELFSRLFVKACCTLNNILYVQKSIGSSLLAHFLDTGKVYIFEGLLHLTDVCGHHSHCSDASGSMDLFQSLGGL